MDKQEAEKLAALIVDKLFTNGQGQKAERLMLVLPDGRDGGGWGRKPMADLIARILTGEKT